MRQHAAGGMTRIFYAKGFDASWFEAMSLGERMTRRDHLVHENDIHRVIMDEITAHDLISVDKYETVQWVDRCATEIDVDHTSELAELFAKFRDYLSIHPCDSDAMSWDLFHQISLTAS
jgi:hypothetical protein